MNRYIPLFAAVVALILAAVGPKNLLRTSELFTWEVETPAEAAQHQCAFVEDVRSMRVYKEAEKKGGGKKISTGSSIAVLWQGKVRFVTNHHVAKKGEKVTLTDQQGRKTEATVVDSVYNAKEKKGGEVISWPAGTVKKDIAVLEMKDPTVQMEYTVFRLYEGELYTGPAMLHGYPQGDLAWAWGRYHQLKTQGLVHDAQLKGKPTPYTRGGASGSVVGTCDKDDPRVLGAMTAVPTDQHADVYDPDDKRVYSSNGSRDVYAIGRKPGAFFVQGYVVRASVIREILTKVYGPE